MALNKNAIILLIFLLLSFVFPKSTFADNFDSKLGLVKDSTGQYFSYLSDKFQSDMELAAVSSSDFVSNVTNQVKNFFQTLFSKTPEVEEGVVETKQTNTVINTPKPTVVTPKPTEQPQVVIKEVVKQSDSPTRSEFFSALSNLRNDLTALISQNKFVTQIISTPSTSSNDTRVQSRESLSRQFDSIMRSVSESISSINSLSDVTISGGSFSGSATLDSLTLSGSATSTFANGINLTGGCVAINGTCISGGGGGGSGTVNSGTANQLAYYAADGTTLSGIATSTLGLLTTDVAEGSNLYFTNTRFDSRFITQLAATTSVSSITALPNLALSTTQLTSGTLGVARGGTGATSFGQGWLYSDGGTNSLAASTSPTVNYVTATSTTATSTFYGGLSAASSLYVLLNGNVGIGTSAPLAKFDVNGNLILSGSNSYLNFGSTSGTSGYGFRDNAGTMEFKNSGGSWTGIGSGSGSGSDKFATSSNGVAIYPNSAYGLVLGLTATTTNSRLEVNGTTTSSNFVANSSTATSTFASTVSVGSTTPQSVALFSVGTQTPAFVVNRNSGYVGIGTTTPTANLEIKNSNTGSSPTSLPTLALDSNTYTNLLFKTNGVSRAAIQADSSGNLNNFASSNGSINFYRGGLSSNTLTAQVNSSGLTVNSGNFYVSSGGGYFQSTVSAGSSALAPSTLTSFGSLGLKTTLITSNTTLSSSYTNVLVDATAAASCTGTPSVTTCSSYSSQVNCELHDARGGCSWSAVTCSSYNGDEGTCTSYGCTWDSASCSAYNNDQMTCQATSGCSYPGNAGNCNVYNNNSSVCSATSGCSYPGNAGDCSVDFADNYAGCAGTLGCSGPITDCAVWDGTDQGTCEATMGCSWNAGVSECQVVCSGTYDNGVCTGNYDDGSCTGTYNPGTCSGTGGSCSGTATCSGINDSTNCAAESGCSWNTAVSITMPATASNLERQYWIKNVGTGGTVTILPNSGQTIDGQSSFDLSGRDDSIELGFYWDSANCSAFDSNESTCGSTTGCTQNYSTCSYNIGDNTCSGDSGSTCSAHNGDEAGCNSQSYFSNCSGTYTVSVKWNILSDKSGYNTSYSTTTSGRAAVISKGLTDAFSHIQFQNNSGTALGSVFGTTTGIGLQRSVANGSLYLNYDGGNVAVGATTTPWRTLSVVGTVAFSGLSSFSSGDSALCISSNNEIKKNNGVTSCTSSSRIFKHDIETLSSSTDKFMQLRPVSFVYNDSELPAIGFIAEEVADIDERLAEWSEGKPKSLSIAAILSLTVNSVQELWHKFTLILPWFAGDGSKFSVQGDVCVDDICISKEQFKYMLISGSGASFSTSSDSNILGNTEENDILTTTSASTTDIIDYNASTTNDIATSSDEVVPENNENIIESENSNVSSSTDETAGEQLSPPLEVTSSPQVQPENIDTPAPENIEEVPDTQEEPSTN